MTSQELRTHTMYAYLYDHIYVYACMYTYIYIYIPMHAYMQKSICTDTYTQVSLRYFCLVVCACISLSLSVSSCVMDLAELHRQGYPEGHWHARSLQQE